MKKLLFSTLATGLLLVGCGGSKTTTTPLATQTAIETSIDLSKVKDDKVPVTINPGRFTTETVTYRLPRVVQGTYSVSDFGKYIDSFTAFNYKGEEFAEGECILLKGTIAEHRTSKFDGGKPLTYLNRVTVVRNLGSKENPKIVFGENATERGSSNKTWQETLAEEEEI